jgi:hypothetical protein
MTKLFRALDVKNGKILWKTKLATSVQSFPVSFGIGGKQCVAVTTGRGGGGITGCFLFSNHVQPGK